MNQKLSVILLYDSLIPLALACSKSAIETPEQCVQSVQSRR